MEFQRRPVLRRADAGGVAYCHTTVQRKDEYADRVHYLSDRSALSSIYRA